MFKNTVNVNDNEIVGTTSNYNDNVNDRGRKIAKSRKVEEIADKLVAIFGNDTYRAFYCRVAWNLTEARIWENVELAQKGDHPGKLFSYLCKRDGI